MAGRLTIAALGAAGTTAALGGAAWFLIDHQNPAIRPGPPGSSSPSKPVSPPWTAAALGDLIAAIDQADREGLRSSDYKIEALREVVRRKRGGAEVDALADAAALSLARDFTAGHVRGRHRFNWYIDYAGPSSTDLSRTIAAVRLRAKLGGWFDGLLPTSPDYRALRDALASTPADDETRRDRIRANMERWRWLPRDFGRGDQLYVNLPAYRLDVIGQDRIPQRARDLFP